MTLSQTPARHFRSQGRSFPMFCFVRTSLTTIGLTSIALAALAGGRASRPTPTCSRPSSKFATKSATCGTT